MLSKVAENISICNLNYKDMLREVTVKIGLERVNIQKELMVEALLDSGTTELVMSLEFAKKIKVSTEKNRKTNICEKCGWNIQQERTNRKYYRGEYLLSRT